MKRHTIIAALIAWLLIVILGGAFGGQAIGAPMAQNVDREDIIVSVGGLGGAQTANTNSLREMRGEIKSLYIDFGPTVVFTTDLAIKTKTAPQQTILSLTNTMTDGQYYPAAQLTGSDGSALSAYVAYPVADWLNFTVTEGWTSTITVTVVWGD